jgi:preprotein translocase subunit SecA
VTIATNMAGRGVDIKLGGDLDEDYSWAMSTACCAAPGMTPLICRMKRRQALKKMNV